MNLDDVGIVDCLQNQGLIEEVLDKFGVVRKSLLDDFSGEELLRVLVDRSDQLHLPSVTVSESPDYLILVEGDLRVSHCILWAK